MSTIHLIHHSEDILCLAPEKLNRELGMNLLAEITSQIMGGMRRELQDGQ